SQGPMDITDPNHPVDLSGSRRTDQPVAVTIKDKTLSYTFSGILKSGESYTKELDNGLIVTIKPDAKSETGHSSGWTIDILSKESGASQAEIICLPLHGCNNCEVDPWCTVLSEGPNAKPHVPDERSIEIGLGKPDDSAYSKDPYPPSMRVPSFK